MGVAQSRGLTKLPLSVIVRKNRAIAKDRGQPFTFKFSQYESYLKRLTTMAFGEVAVRFSSRYHYFEILGPRRPKKAQILANFG